MPASALRDPTPPPSPPRPLPGLRAGSDPSWLRLSPGGEPEVEIRWLAEHLGEVRVVDVREAAEVRSEGHIEGAEWVPMTRLAEQAWRWDRSAPIVLVCRSGRRSSRAVRVLESMGYQGAGSLTGGMLAWRAAGLPVVHRERPPVDRTACTQEGPGSHEPLDEGAIARGLAAQRIRWVRAAALLLGGDQACVDGRDDHSVLGTPGGDAGELLLTLAAAERLRGAPFTDAEVSSLLDLSIDSFGLLYLHTDDHALSALERSLRADPRFGEEELAEGAEELLRMPPLHLREALLERLIEPAHVGCGHLRLVREHPEEYGVRGSLWVALIRAIFTRLWSEPEHIDFVVLHGHHEERAVLTVRLEHGVHAYTNVPSIAPHLGEASVFVYHPEVASFLREQRAELLVERGFLSLPAEGEALPLERFRQTQEELATRQLRATLRHLAHDLPVFELCFRGGEVEVVATTGKKLPNREVANFCRQEIADPGNEAVI